MSSFSILVSVQSLDSPSFHNLFIKAAVQPVGDTLCTHSGGFDKFDWSCTKLYKNIKFVQISSNFFKMLPPQGALQPIVISRHRKL